MLRVCCLPDVHQSASHVRVICTVQSHEQWVERLDRSPAMAAKLRTKRAWFLGLRTADLVNSDLFEMCSMDLCTQSSLLSLTRGLQLYLKLEAARLFIIVTKNGPLEKHRPQCSVPTATRRVSPSAKAARSHRTLNDDKAHLTEGPERTRTSPRDATVNKRSGSGAVSPSPHEIPDTTILCGRAFYFVKEFPCRMSPLYPEGRITRINRH